MLTPQHQSLAFALGGGGEPDLALGHRCTPQSPAFRLLEPGPSLAAAPPALPDELFFTRSQLFWQVFCKLHYRGFAISPGLL